MRIAQFTDTFLPQVNGIATYVANLSEELGRQGHRVIIFTPKQKIRRKKFRARNVRVVYIPSLPDIVYPEYNLGLISSPIILKHLRKFKPDIIHSHSLLTLGIDAVIAAKTLRVPLVTTCHVYLTTPDFIGWIKNERGRKILAKSFFHYSKFFFNAANLNIVPSKKLTEELHRVGIKNSLVVVPNGITLPENTKTDDKLRLKKTYKLARKVVLHFGRLSREKNVDQVILAFSKINKLLPDTSLLVIGDGPHKKELEELVKKLGLKDKVIFTGFIAHQDLLSKGFISAGDVFVTASTMENQPLAVLEAMAAGLPVVGVSAAGLTELVRENGFLVKPGDTKGLAKKSLEILENPKLAKKMSKASRQLAYNFSIEKTTGEIISLYEKVRKENAERKQTKIIKLLKALELDELAPKKLIPKYQKWYSDKRRRIGA